jgi:hypothetical protein
LRRHGGNADVVRQDLAREQQHGIAMGQLADLAAI